MQLKKNGWSGLQGRRMMRRNKLMGEDGPPRENCQPSKSSLHLTLESGRSVGTKKNGSLLFAGRGPPVYARRMGRFFGDGLLP